MEDRSLPYDCTDVDLRFFVTGGSGTGTLQYAIAFNGKPLFLSENSLFSFPSIGIFTVQVRKNGDSQYYTQLSNIANFNIESVPASKKCEIAAIPISKTTSSEKQQYSDFVRNSTYKQVIVGPPSNIEVYVIKNTSFSFKFDTVGYPIEFTYTIKDISSNITKYTVESSSGRDFTFNDVAANTTYFLEVFVQYSNITKPFGILNPVVITTLNEKPINVKSFSLSARNNSINVTFSQPQNKPGKYVVNLRDLSDNSHQEIEIRNVYFTDFYGDKKATFTDLKIGQTYEIFIETYFTFSDGGYKEPLPSPTQTIQTLYECVLDISMTIITGNSFYIKFIPNLNTVSQPTRYFVKHTKMSLTEEGKWYQVANSTVIDYDNSFNSIFQVTGLEKNTRYLLYVSNTYITLNGLYTAANEYDNTTYFYTRNEGPVSNFNTDMYNTYGSLHFKASPLVDYNYETLQNVKLDISFGSFHITLSGDASEYIVSSLDISSIYFINIRTTYSHDISNIDQTNVYDFSGVFYTLNEGPCKDISFLDINAFDVDCVFSDRYVPDHYIVTRSAPNGQTRTLTIEGTSAKQFQFFKLLNYTVYSIEIVSVFSNLHSYNLSSSFQTKNEGPLVNLYSYQYSTNLYLFVDFSSNTFTDMSNTVNVTLSGETFKLSTYPFKTLYDNSVTQNTITGNTRTFYVTWTEYIDSGDIGYAITISNEYMRFQRQIPSNLGEIYEPNKYVNRTSVVDLGDISSTTTITFTGSMSISNVVVYPVVKVISNFNNTSRIAFDVSMANRFDGTLNSYTYNSTILSQNELPLPDMSFSFITGYSFLFSPIGLTRYITSFKISSDPMREGLFDFNDQSVSVINLSPDTSYTILTSISYPQPSRFLYPSYQNYEKSFRISTRNESRIASLDISYIRAESMVLRFSNVFNYSDISSTNIYFTNDYYKITRFVSLSNGQFPYTLSGLPIDSCFNIVTKHVYKTTGNSYDSSGFWFTTKNESKVARVPGILNDLVHRIDETNDNNKMNLFIKYASPVGDPSHNTLYYKLISDVSWTKYQIPNKILEFDFSGSSGQTFQKNNRYSIYVRTTYKNGNTYDTLIFDFSATQISVLNVNYLLDFSNSGNRFDSYSYVYYTVPYFWNLTNGYMAYDVSNLSNFNKTIVTVPNQTQNGPVAILFHAQYSFPAPMISQTIEVILEVKKYTIRFWYANVYDILSRPYYNDLQNKTDNIVSFSVYLKDIATNTAIQNTRFVISSSSTSWTLFDMSFSLNTRRELSSIDLVIERTGYEYNMLGLMNIQLLQQSVDNMNYSVGVLRNIIGVEGLIYNIVPIVSTGTGAWDMFSTATEYSLTIIYDNTVAERYVSSLTNAYYKHTLFVSNLSYPADTSFNITGQTTVFDVSGFTISGNNFVVRPNQRYQLYVQTDYYNQNNSLRQSSSSQYVDFYAIPYQSPARIIYNISFGYHTLVDYYSRMRQTNLWSQFLDEDMYAVNICFRPPFGDPKTFTNTLHVANLSTNANVKVEMPSPHTLYTFAGIDHTDISGLYLDISYRIFISTVYSNGQRFETASFDFRIDPSIIGDIVIY
jgi:hypothetical protein